MSYLEKRKGLIDGVCISGGEPMLQDTLDMIKNIKKMGYLVKLDTNGSRPDKLQEYVESGYIDYVAMDIKNCKAKYAETVGMQAPTLVAVDGEKAETYANASNIIAYVNQHLAA